MEREIIVGNRKTIKVTLKIPGKRLNIVNIQEKLQLINKNTRFSKLEDELNIHLNIKDISLETILKLNTFFKELRVEENV